MSHRSSRLLAILLFTAAGAIALRGNAAGDTWVNAAPGYHFTFPRDHAAHPGYKIEWWYYTGNLKARDGRRFGYQLTFFRIGIDFRPRSRSRWAVRDLFMAHLAVTDIRSGRHVFAERLNRAGPGWAGASSTSYHVWNEGWQAELDPGGKHHLQAREGEMGLKLELESEKPLVLHGVGGFSRKGARPASASEYYSFTRMTTRGELLVEGEPVAVEGLSWMDHEFGSSLLESGQVGWDWLSIQLEDGTDLMLFQLRRSDGRQDAHASGTIVDAKGRVLILSASQFDMQPGRRWRSPESGAQYPLQWRVRIPERRLDLTVNAAVENQELRTQSSGITYWEGATDVTGFRADHALHGRGYLEMTGYAGSGSKDSIFP